MFDYRFLADVKYVIGAAILSLSNLCLALKVFSNILHFIYVGVLGSLYGALKIGVM